MPLLTYTFHYYFTKPMIPPAYENNNTFSLFQLNYLIPKF